MKKELKKEIQLFSGIALVVVLALVIGQQFGFDPLSGGNLRGTVTSFPSMPSTPSTTSTSATTSISMSSTTTSASSATSPMPSSGTSTSPSSPPSSGTSASPASAANCDAPKFCTAASSCTATAPETASFVNPGGCTGTNKVCCILSFFCTSEIAVKTYDIYISDATTDCIPFPVTTPPTTTAAYFALVKSKATEKAQGICNGKANPTCPKAPCVINTSTVAHSLSSSTGYPAVGASGECTNSKERKGKWKGTCKVDTACQNPS